MLYYKNIIWNTVKKLSNLNASIFILLLIATISILGTIIEQDQTLNYYKLHYPIKSSIMNFSWEVIIFLGLNNIYLSWWFISLITLFFCTLIACTFSRQLPSLKNTRYWKFTPYNQSDTYTQTLAYKDIKVLSKVIYELNRKYYYVIHKGDRIYGYKGIIGRIAPIFVHISIIMTLTGSILGLFNGFTAQQMIPNSEIFHIQNIIRSGYQSNLPYNLVGKIDNFLIKYNNDTSIQQFYSSISLFSNLGERIDTQKIAVNFPLKFHGVTFYQTDWRISSIRLQVKDGYNIQQHLQKVTIDKNRFWVYRLPISTNKYINLIISNLKDGIMLYSQDGTLLGSVYLNDTFYINNIAISIKEVMTQTGIQIKTDPGIKFVYTGFLTLIISIIMSYISYSQIWIYYTEGTMQIQGTTNRSKLMLEEELEDIQKSIIFS